MASYIVLPMHRYSTFVEVGDTMEANHLLYWHCTWVLSGAMGKLVKDLDLAVVQKDL